MAALQKITTTYAESEDRLRLAGQDAAGTTVRVLWLTQRLTNRLVQTLTQWLEAEGSGAALTTADLRHAWEQDVAVRQMQPSTPVPVMPNIPGALVDVVDLARNGRQYTIDFRQADTTTTLTLSNTQLRQWLGILRSLYQVAGWPLADWPTWMDDVPRMAQHPMLFH